MENNQIQLIDTHCHLHDREFFNEGEQEKALERALEKGVSRIICIGTDVDDSLAAREFAREHSQEYAEKFVKESGKRRSSNNWGGVFWTFGVHPGEAESLEKVQLVAKEAREALEGVYKFDAEKGEEPLVAGKNPPELPVAIGEIGLDYHYKGYDREAQIRLFEEMLQLAVDYELPVSFHVREAFSDFFPVVANFSGIRGVVHSFSDNKKNLRRILEETELFVGVNGMATYSTLPLAPLERIVLETDAPFLAPEPVRGEKNEPGNVRLVAEWLAEKMGKKVSKIGKETTENARRIFGV